MELFFFTCMQNTWSTCHSLAVCFFARRIYLHTGQDVVAGEVLACPGVTIGGIAFNALDPKASCVPHGDKTTAGMGGYLMFPSVANDPNSQYGNKWSTCSQADVKKTVDKDGSCFAVPNPCAQGGACCENGQLK